MLQNFRDIQSWMYLSWTATAEGHSSDRGSGFQANTLRLMPLNLYMCQWLWFKGVTALLALNKRSTMLPCFSLLFDMTSGLLTCQGGGTDAVWVVVSIIINWESQVEGKTFQAARTEIHILLWRWGELLVHVQQVKGNACRHSLTSPSGAVRTLWETVLWNRYFCHRQLQSVHKPGT